VSAPVSAFAPASVSNVACGFDILGFAIEGLGDTVTAELGERGGVVIGEISGDDGELPREAARNTAGIAATALVERHAPECQGIRLSIHKGMPLSSGLGSSAASAVAAVVAIDRLLGLELSREELIACAVEGERFIGGSAHCDNVAPSLVGGLVLARGATPPALVELPVPEGMSCALVRPHLRLHTGEGRALLGDSLPLRTAVTQWGNVAGLVAGLFLSDWQLIADCLVDVVAEPHRAARVPGFAEAKAAALEAGALGGSLSGSGPAIFALCRDADIAGRASEAMHGALLEAGVTSDRCVSPVGAPGARVLAPDPAGALS